MLLILNIHPAVYNTDGSQNKIRSLCQKKCAERNIPTFVFYDFQLSQELILICFAEKQDNNEAAMFTKMILHCECFWYAKKIFFCENILFLLLNFLTSFRVGTETPLSVRIPASFVVSSYIMWQLFTFTELTYYICNYNYIFTVTSYHIAQTVLSQEATIY